MRTTLTATLTTAVALLALAAPAAAAPGVTEAGVAVVDGTWHVGASAGQYASDPQVEDSFDPGKHQSRRAASYGVQSRLSIRALVVEGPDGKQVAIVKNDLYLPQDLLWRRTAHILEKGKSGITRDELTMAVTHNHSSPYYSSTAPGVWTFQDVYDVRFFEYYAQQMAKAVEKAAADTKPVRIGAAVSQFDKTHRHSFGPALADDGSPAGYPHEQADHDLSVVRFDDISDPSNPKPLANLVSFSLHPEMLDGNDLISADYIAPMERIADRETGAVTIFTQNAVGTAEPERSTYHSIHERLEFTHKEYAQAEYAGRLTADAIKTTAAGVVTGEGVGQRVPFEEGAEVGVQDKWYPGPVSHPFPTVSNCNLEKPTDQRVPGIPTCESPFEFFGVPKPPPALTAGPQLTIDQLKAAGVPIPTSFSTPSYGALQEDMSVHLQALRIGDILLTVCSCEQWKDQSENIKARTNTVVGDHDEGPALGYDWTQQCTPIGDGGTYSCPDPRNEAGPRLTITKAIHDKVRAQVRNNASGWDFVENVREAELDEPEDPAKIRGNYSHEELEPKNGFALTIPIGMANDYNGYIATYREFRRGDHYRKALTAWGPHSSDYLATRLVELSGHLKQPAGNVLPLEDKRREADAFAGGQEQVRLDLEAQDVRAEGLGDVGEQSIPAYEATLPDDGGDAQPIAQPPAVIERFAAARFTWNGGNNYVDNPDVVVERQVGDGWETYADQTGELPVFLKFPKGTDVASYAAGGEIWEWSADFEAFVGAFNVGRPERATPAGTYRFVAKGKRRDGRATVPYTVTSKTFRVQPWRGVTVEDFRLEADNTMSFKIGPRNQYPDRATPGAIVDEIGPIDYPDSYESDVRFINDQRTAYRDPADPTNPDKLEWYCFECSFRPWLDAGDAATTSVTVIRADDTIEDVPAKQVKGRWVTARKLAPGESALVAAEGVADAHGNVNGAASPLLSRPAGPAGPGSGPTGQPGTSPQPGGQTSVPGTGGSGGGPAAGSQPGGQTSTPGTVPGGGSAAGCADRLAPVSRFAAKRATRSGVVLRGASRDRGCGRLQRVFVSIARSVTGRKCRYLQANGSFSAPRSCLRTSYLPARGTTAWSFKKRVRLPRGAYKVWVRGLDVARNVEGKRQARNFTRLRVR